MLRILSKIFSRITSALEANAVQRPTHFPAIKSARELEDAEEPLQDDDGAENKDGDQPR